MVDTNINEKNDSEDEEDTTLLAAGIGLIFMAIVGGVVAAILITVGTFLMVIVLGYLIFGVGWIVAGLSVLAAVIGVLLTILGIFAQIFTSKPKQHDPQFGYHNQSYDPNQSQEVPMLHKLSFIDKLITRFSVSKALKKYNIIDPKINYVVKHLGAVTHMTPQEVHHRNIEPWSVQMHEIEDHEFKFQCLVCNEVFNMAALSFSEYSRILKKRTLYNSLITLLILPLAFFDLFENGRMTYTLGEIIITGLIAVPIFSLILNYPFNKLWEKKHPILSIASNNHEIVKEEIVTN